MVLARLILVAACALGASQAAVAQSFPSKAVKFVLNSQHVAAGRVRALAIAQRARSRVIPDVPTFSELGFPQVGTVTWFDVLLP